MSESEIRIPYDESSDNGLVLGDVYIPEELLSEIFCQVDYKTLCACQLVCKRWNLLIQSYIWRKKAEMTAGHVLPVDEETPWTTYYLICHKKPFNKNLIKRPSGKKTFEDVWTVERNAGDGWIQESPPVGVPPLPDDPVFEGKTICYVTSYGACSKKQIINLVDEGLSEYLLDNLQPTIKVSEWYSCRWDCPAIYECFVKLLPEKGVSGELLKFELHKMLEGEDQNKWFRFEHEFKNYGKGLRRILFAHGGHDRNFWAGNYGSKMAGACVKVEVPEFHQTDNSTKSD